jgi:hypothetical protein
MMIIHGDDLRRDPAHRLVCERCRVGARIDAAWRHVAPPAVPEVAPGEEFVSRVVAAVRRDRRAATRERVLFAAAAALLFSFFAGLAHEQASNQRPAPEDTYASAVTPSVLEGILPN